MFKKLLKIIAAFFLLPFCIGGVLALWQIISSANSAGVIWLTVLAGALFWILIYIFLPKPQLIYVFGHELTHALATWIFGGKLKKIKVGSAGGHVLITKSNFLISLAPYFFPLYVVLVVIIYALGNFFWNWTQYVLWFYFFVGMMYAFHITLTIYTLKIEQPDINEEGYIFSAVIIFLGNIFVLLVGVPLLTAKISIAYSLDSWFNYSLQIYHYIGLHL
jgi:hypothetical protein